MSPYPQRASLQWVLHNISVPQIHAHWQSIAFATLMLLTVQHTDGGLQGWREVATMLLSFLATHARKPTDKTKLCHLYGLMGLATHFVHMVQFDLIRIQSLHNY